MSPLNRLTKLLLLFGVITLFTLPSFADNIVLDFEGLKNNEQVKDFYNGGTGSEGSSSGKNYGISFSAPTLAIIDADAGGSGNFANEPSPNTVIYFLNDDKVIMNVKDGFSGGFSFWYTSIDYSGSVEVWTGENGTGKLITSMELEPLGSEPDGGDPTGTYNRWKKVSVSFDGEAHSVVFKGVANKIGFDNIALNPDSGEEVSVPGAGINIGTVSTPVDNDDNEPGWVRHGVSMRADEFETVFSVATETEEQRKFVEEFCQNTNSFIVSNSTVAAKEEGCEVKDSGMSWWLGKHYYQITLKFRIQPNSSGGLWFENGHLEICKNAVITWDETKEKTGECVAIRSLPEFSVYGTKFDVTRDGFAFKNGDWNRASTIYGASGKPIYKNTVAKIGDVIADYLTFKGQEEFWASVGYENEYYYSIVPQSSNSNLVGEGSVYYGAYGFHVQRYFHDSDGLCHGMALSSAANFNLRDQQGAWGIRPIFIQAEWEKDVEDHWNRQKLEANKPYKPFDKITHDYSPDFQAMEKIMYYYVAWPGWSDSTMCKDKTSWVGQEKEALLNATFVGIKHALEEGYVTDLYMDTWYTNGKQAWAHTVTLVGLIEVNGITKYVVYNNNHPDVLCDIPLKLNDIGDRRVDYEYCIYPNGKIKKYLLNDVTYLTSIKTDPLHIIPNIPSRAVSKTRSTQPIPEQEDQSISYLFQNHIKVYVVGGTFVDVKSTDGREILLHPLSAELKKEVAYKGEFNSFKNILLLPADKKYKVTVKKSGTFPFLKVFATIPYDNGTAEYVVYDHAEISENGTTYATFTIGRNNNDKNMYREDSAKRAASPFAPTFIKTYKTILPSPSALEGIVLQNGVKLSWKNPQHPDFKEVVVVRKESEIPTSIDNGTKIYRGSDETVTDTPPDMNKVYCYSVFAVGKDGDVTEPNSVCIDTYKYTLYGHVTDENGNPVSGALVKLYNKDKSKLINMASTDDKGLFVFNGLLDGNYVLTFEHPFYIFDDNETNVTLQNGSKEVDVKATGKPAIFMDVPQEVETGSKQRIIWDGVHVKSGDTVSIKLLIDNNTYTIADQLPFNKRYYDWNVSIPAKAVRADNNNATATVATLRVELDSDPSAYAEKEIVITRSSENTSSNGNSNPPHSENSVGCSIVPQGSFSNGILNFFLMASGLIGLVGYRRKKH